jgi:cytochrome P450
MVGTDDARQVLRWGLRHGLMRAFLLRGARGGDLGARLMVDATLRDDPYPSYEELRVRGRIVHTGLAPTSVDHAVCTAVLRSPDFGSGARDPSNLSPPVRLAMRLAQGGPLDAADPPSMLAVDPPDHTRYRKLVTRAFSARRVAALSGRVAEIADELLDAMAAKAAAGGPVDLIADYASLLPATVIAEMLGAPVEMRRQFLRWGAGAALSLDPGLTLRDYRRAQRDQAALQGWMVRHLERLRRSPGDDLLSALVAVHDEGGVDGKSRGLTDDELLSIASLVLAAGFETTVNLLGNGAALLVAHPDQLAALREGRASWATATEEVLRFDSPAQRTGRLAHRDTEVAGERVAGGSLVILILAGANRDPAVFADPQRFDVTRTDADRHIAFSQGIHYCLGAGLARMEGEIGLRALFARFPDLALAGPPHRRPTRLLRGFDTMPVTLGAPVRA